MKLQIYIYKTMRGGMVKTVKLGGYQVLPQCSLAGLPQQLFVLKNERVGSPDSNLVRVVHLAN